MVDERNIKMKITVITIVYNDLVGIESTISSVIRQSAFQSMEYIVVDGASTDGTTEAIKKYLGKIAHYICEPDSGIYNAMNKGLKHATGDYVIFINSGDSFTDDQVVENIIKYIGNDNPDVVFGNYREISNNFISRVIPCRNAEKIWYGPVASHQSTLYRVEHLRRHNLRYDESYRIAADYKLTAEAIVKASSVLKTDICISDFDISGVSSTNQNKGLAEANRVRKEAFEWNAIKIASLSAVLLCARYAKKYLNPIYKLIRFR